MQSVVEIDMSEFETAAPAVLTIFAIPLTFSIAQGIGIGLICSVLLRVGLGKARQVPFLGYAVAFMFFLSFFKIWPFSSP
jgi:AGZA family xanthine/uracil permease-like MFS transporter